MDTRKPSVGVSGGGGGRDDCWSDGATAVLVEAWGQRHLRCNRGNLRQNDWREVSDAVNRRQSAAGKPPRTDIQCKNRIDTLKKKYKIEKAKSSPSTWPFFDSLDFLIGPSNSKPSPGVSISVTPPTPNPNPNPNPNWNMKAEWSETERSVKVDDEELFGVIGTGTGRGRKHKLEETAAFRELARAISNFGEIYERIESSKQELVMELEKQRMELSKELEFHRMNMLLDAHLALDKFKRSKVVPASTGSVMGATKSLALKPKLVKKSKCNYIKIVKGKNS